MKKIFSLIFLSGIIFYFYSESFSQDYPPGENQNPSILQPVNVQQKTQFNGNQTDDPRVVATVIPNNGSTSGNGRAPQGSRLFINTKYLIKNTEMTASGFGGNVITSVGWTWLASTAQLGATTGNLRVYVRDTVATADSLGNTTTFSVAGMTKIIDGTISIPAGTGPFSIDVLSGGPGTVPFAPTPGMSLLLAFEYNTTSGITTPLGAPTVWCTNTTALPNPGDFPTNTRRLLTCQSQSAYPTIGTFSNFRPETRLGNNKVDVYAVSNIWGLGKVPTPWGCPDTICYRIQKFIPNPQPIVVRIRIININPFPGNIKFDSTFVLNVDHPNPFDTILAWQRPWNYPGWKNDSIIIEVLPKPGEDIVNNNRLDWRQDITCDAWNWARSNKNPDGGVGFTGGVGTFIACFRNNCPIPTPLWAVDLCFAAATGGGNLPYKVAVFGEGPTGPGPLLYMSELYASPPGITGTAQRVQRPLPNVMIPPNSRFYVGVVQKNTTNLAYCYQSENPVKTGRFYFSVDTVGSGPWTDFGPNNAPFRLDICPRTVSRVNLSAYLEGFYNGTTMVADTARLQARAATSPYALVDVAINHLQSNGMGWFEFCRLECNVPYYFVVRHRNHIQTWTANPLVYDCELPYNFTDNLNKAYGGNMIFVPGDANSEGVGGGYAFYTSDVNQDDVVDGFDCSAIDNDAANFAEGYLATDVNGDMIVDGFDLAFCDNNSANFVAAITPP